VAFVRALHVLLIAGFFITLVLAWYHGEKGRQRVSGPELLLIALLLGIAGGGLFSLRGSGLDGEAEEGVASAERPVNEDPRPSIIVLACRNISPDPEDAYVAEGLHEAILHKLVGVSGLRSLGRETANWYRDNPKLPAEIAAERGLDFVGECSIRKYRNENRIVVTFQLLDAEGAHVWSEEYDRDLSAEAEFEIQADVARQVAERVQAGLTQEERLALEEKPASSAEAYDAYLRGRNLNLRAGTENARMAIRLLNEAIELDPEFSEAHVELGRAYHILGWFTNALDPAPLADSAQVHLERAIQLDDRNAEGFAALSWFLLMWRWDLPGAERAIQRALALNPRLPGVRRYNATLLYYKGKLEEALAEARVALDQDPLNWYASNQIGNALELLGRYEEAKAQFQRALEVNPDNTINIACLAGIHVFMDLPDSALAKFHGIDIADVPWVAAGRMRAYLQLGDRNAALEEYAELQSVADQTRVSKAYLALAALPLDEDEAGRLLVQAVQERDPYLLDVLTGWKQYWPPALREEILRRMGFGLEGDRLVALEGGS
jgi:serine/threonine-protein kinase